MDLLSLCQGRRRRIRVRFASDGAGFAEFGWIPRRFFRSPGRGFGNIAQENTMVPRISRSLPVSAILAAVLAMLTPQALRADREVTFQEDGGVVTKVADVPDFTFALFNGTYGPGPGGSDFKVTVFGATSDN